MNEKKNKKLIGKTGVVLLFLISILALSACSNEAKASTVMTEQKIPEGTSETVLPVEISMPEYTLSYSGELKNVITTKEIQNEEKVGLQFSVLLSESEAPIFTLFYHSDEGELVTVLTDIQGNKIPVAFEMKTIPENLSEEDADLFYTAQDAVNEIVESLVIK